MEEESASNPRKSAANKRRPGAPRGNMNALKHGRTSRQLAELGAILAMDPTIRDALLQMAPRFGAPRRRAQETAALLLMTYLARAGKIAEGQLNWKPDPDDLNSILEGALRADPARFNKPKKARKRAQNNSQPATRTENQ